MAASPPHIYLDNAATTRPDPGVVAVMQPYLREAYGNASSLHRLGLEADRGLRRARQQVATALDATPEEIVFTSGGTEANSLALWGAAAPGRRSHFVASAVEHPSVLGTLRLLEEHGHEVTLVPVDREGRVDADEVVAAVRPETVVVALMLVQNEIGTVEPVPEVALRLRRAGHRSRLHVDAVQALGKEPVSVHDLGCDTASVSSHKIHGPKGAGALFLRSGLHLRPLFGGGKQEGGHRPGTENVPALVGFGAAAALSMEQLPEARHRMAELRDRLFAALAQTGIEAQLCGPPLGSGRACYSLSLAFAGIPAEVLLHALEARGVYVSSGSACASRQRGRSHVLRAIGLPDGLEAIRITLSRETTAAEVDQAARALVEALQELRP